jgi:type IV pilus assembly protein PilB
VRLTGRPPGSADDLRAALADHVADRQPAGQPPWGAEDSSDESSRAVRAHTPPGPAPDLVRELRIQVEVVEALEASASGGAGAAAPPAGIVFGPSTFAPRPAPAFDLPGGDGGPPVLPPFDLSDPFELPGAGPATVPPAPGGTPRQALTEGDELLGREKPAAEVRIKKSGVVRKPRGRRFARKTPPDAPDGAAPPASRAGERRVAAAPPVGPGAPETEPGSTEGDDGGPRHTGRPLGELLVGRGAVSEDQLRDALTAQTGSGKRLGNILVELGLLSERALVDALSEQLQVPIVDLAHAELDREVATLLPEDDARRLRAVPIGRDGVRVEVAVADPLLEHLQEELIEKLEAPVRLRFATATEIEAVINKMFTPDADLGDALRLFEARLEARKSAKESESTVTTVVDENAPVVKIVNLILDQAVRDRASDVHIEPMEDVVRVRLRTDGALHEAMTLPGPIGASLISRIKVMSEMNIVERRKPQDGQLAIKVAGRDLDVRVSTTPTVFGEKCVLRVLDKTKAVIDLPGLGMAPDTYRRYSDLIRSPYGMVICAGPTGSGKTTTLYATLTAINHDDINVVTVEDPVEYVFPTINQIQINEAAGLTFASGLRSILRQDPDAILVGEIRDVETARIAVQAALTGHFVMSSLHATDATSALHRFMDMGIEPFLVASSLLGVVGQRLVRKVCPLCAATYEPTPDERAFFERGGGDPAKTEFVYGTGCNFCGNTGYYDRVGIYEVLGVTDELKELIVQNAPHAALRKLAIEQGMRTLRDQAVQLVMQDKTTIAEVLRTVYVL